MCWRSFKKLRKESNRRDLVDLGLGHAAVEPQEQNLLLARWQHPGSAVIGWLARRGCIAARGCLGAQHPGAPRPAGGPQRHRRLTGIGRSGQRRAFGVLLAVESWRTSRRVGPPPCC
jgi:hypothetical protein